MLSQMAKTFFGESPVMSLPIVALIIFGCVFLAVSVRAFRGDPQRYDELAQLPLEGGTENE